LRGHERIEMALGNELLDAVGAVVVVEAVEVASTAAQGEGDIVVAEEAEMGQAGRGLVVEGAAPYRLLRTV
jgi:hypothetical protein